MSKNAMKQSKELWLKLNLKKPRIKHELSSNSRKNKKRLKLRKWNVKELKKRLASRNKLQTKFKD